MARLHIRNLDREHLISQRGRTGSKKTLYTQIVHHHSSKSAFKATREATVSRPPNSGPSAEVSDQPLVGEPSTICNPHHE